jgi:hypothetical protein
MALAMTGTSASAVDGVALEVREGKVRSWLPGVAGKKSVLVISVMGGTEDQYPVKVQVVPAPGIGPERRVDGSPLPLGGRVSRVKHGCLVNEEGSNPAAADPARRREFWVFKGGGDVASTSSYRKETGVLRGVADGVEVYVEEGEVEKVTGERILDVVRAFQRVRGPVEELLGPCEDEDRDGRFAFYFTSSLAGLGKGAGTVEGLFRATDLDERMPRPFGNGCDLIYLNPAIRGGGHLEAVVAHEYAHAAYASRKKQTAGDDPHEENWLDEAVAHVVEDLATGERSNIDYRVHEYLEDSGRFGLVVADYYRAGLFRSHGHRGAAYLFLRWCVERDGRGVLRVLAECRETGTGAIEEAMGNEFDSLYREWACELASRGLPNTAGRPFAGIDLLGTFGSIELQGVRPEKIADAKAREWVLPATATKVAEVDAEEDVEVLIEAHEGAGLQVTWFSLEKLGTPE